MTSRFEPWIIKAAKENTNIRYDLIETVGAESRYSSLLPHHITSVVAVFSQEIPTASNILDCTAHIGVDSLNFLNMYPNAELTAVELNPNTAQVLGRNLTNASLILGKTISKQPKVLQGSCVDYMNAYTGPPFDFIYFDPPWGGPEYKTIAKLRLKLEPYFLSDLIPWAFNKGITKTVVAKLPRNADIEDIQTKLSNPEIKLYNIMNSYNILFIRTP
jgi:16S rRNA G966 N2-methylase RsmD